MQVRTALTLAARRYLLAQGELAMTRSELPDQLHAVGRGAAADALEACIAGQPSLVALRRAVSEGRVLLGTTAGAVADHRLACADPSDENVDGKGINSQAIRGLAQEVFEL